MAKKALPPEVEARVRQLLGQTDWEAKYPNTTDRVPRTAPPRSRPRASCCWRSRRSRPAKPRKRRRPPGPTWRGGA